MLELGGNLRKKKHSRERVEEYNIQHHYQTHHGKKKKYMNLQGKIRKEKINEIFAGLMKKQSVFSRSKEISDAAVKASYLIAHEIASASKPHPALRVSL